MAAPESDYWNIVSTGKGPDAEYEVDDAGHYEHTFAIGPTGDRADGYRAAEDESLGVEVQDDLLEPEDRRDFDRIASGELVKKTT